MGRRIFFALALAVLSPPRAFALVGDVNGDRKVDVSDAVHVLEYLFAGGSEPRAAGPCLPWYPCADRANVLPVWGEARFVDNGDGTVTDLGTGLMWEASIPPNRPVRNWEQALRFCAEVELAGYRDWRVPNIRELLSVVYTGYYAMQPALAPIFRNQYIGAPVSSTPFAGSGFSPRAFVLHAYDCRVELVKADWEAPPHELLPDVWCVRGGEGAPISSVADVNEDGGIDISDAIWLLNFLFLGGPPPEAPSCLLATGVQTSYAEGDDGDLRLGRPLRYVDNGDGTVTDLNTGLTWLKTPLPELASTEEEAWGYILSASLPGEREWGLPYLEELLTIVDYGRHHPACDPVFEFREDQYFFLTSSQCIGSQCFFWFRGPYWVDFATASVGYGCDPLGSPAKCPLAIRPVKRKCASPKDEK